MRMMPVKPPRRMDWANYISPEDQERVQNELHYRISSRLDAIVDSKGVVALVLHDGPDYVGDTILGKESMAKLAYILKNSGRTLR